MLEGPDWTDMTDPNTQLVFDPHVLISMGLIAVGFIILIGVIISLSAKPPKQNGDNNDIFFPPF